MSIDRSTTLGRAAAAVAGFAAALVATTASAEFVRVTAANTAGNAVYDITSFASPGTINPLNSDGAKHGQYTAVVQVPNVAAGTVDVIAADAARGQLIRYRPAVGSTAAAVITVWTYSGAGSGPAHPDGLSVDLAGNLYIVSSECDTGFNSPSLWVLPASTTSSTGYASTPLLIDRTFGGVSRVRRLEDTSIALAAGPAWGVGDLVVIAGQRNGWDADDSTGASALMVYRAATLAAILAGSPARTAPDLVAIAPSQFPSGEYPTGFDFWPATTAGTNPTVLVATTAGRVLQYDFAASGSGVTPSLVQVFASGLGSGLLKLKVGLQLEVPYAFVTQSPSIGSGRVLQLGAPVSGKTSVVGTATTGVIRPDGLAVARAAAVPSTSCVITSTAYPLSLPCNLSNGVAPHGILAGAQTVSGNVIEASCVVLSDPRVHAGVCDGTSLDVSTLCPGFGHEVLPGTMCGASGNTGSGFAILRTIASGVDNVPGILIYSDQHAENILPGPSNPVCPNAVLAWAPRQDPGSGEGTIVETEPSSGYPDFLENTGFCDGSGGAGRGMSVYGIGFAINGAALPNGLAGFVDTKYANLTTTIQNANIANGQQNPVKANLLASLAQVGTYIAQAETHAYGSAAANGNYACAAAQVLSVDALVQNDPAPASNYPGNGANPNPWGEVRGRLANLYYTINSRILGATPNKTWPLDPAVDTPAVCQAPVVSIQANPSLISAGGSSTLSWSVDNAATCQAMDGNPGDGWGPNGTPKAVDGQQVILSIPATTTYTLLCTGGGGTNGWGATVVVENAPVIQSFTAQSATVNDGSGTTLSWVVTDASDRGVTENNVTCAVTASDGSVNQSGLAATYSGLATGAIHAPAQPNAVTYSLVCRNALGATTSANNGTTTVTAVPAASISKFAANRSFATMGVDVVTLTYAANVFPAVGGSCAVTSVDGFGQSGLAAAGTVQVGTLGATDTFALSCSNGVSGAPAATSTATVNVVRAPTTSGVTAAPATITTGTSAILSWTAGPDTSCSISGGATLGSPVTDPNTGITSVSTVPLSASGGVQAYTYSLTCTNLAGAVLQPPSIQVQVVPLAALSGGFTAAASTVTAGEATALSWSASNASSCDVTGGGLQAAPAASPYTITPPVGTNTYVLACTNPAGTRTSFDSSPATVTAVPAATIASFTATPSTVTRGGIVTLGWSATAGGGGCALAASDQSLNVANLPATGTQTTAPIMTLATSVSYTLTCSNGVTVAGGSADPNGVATATVSVAVIERIVAANSAGNAIYDVTFTPPGGTASADNSDGSSHGSFSALAFAPDAALGTLDTLAADVTRGQIVRYVPATPTSPATVATAWSYSGTGSGPAHPDGLSLDAGGDLFAVTSKLNDSTGNAVWVLPASLTASTGFAAPRLVDATFSGANGVKQLQESLVASSANAAWGSGDLLVLVGNGSSSNSQPNSNSASLLVYRAASIASVLAGSGSRSGPDLVAIHPAECPSGEYPTGMDVWPADATVPRPTLLVSTTAGRLLRYDFAAKSGGGMTPSYTVFASGLGSGLNKVKVGVENGVPFAFVTQALSSSTGRVMKFAAPTGSGRNAPIATVTSGFKSPDGLAVSH